MFHKKYVKLKHKEKIFVQSKINIQYFFFVKHVKQYFVVEIETKIQNGL